MSMLPASPRKMLAGGLLIGLLQAVGRAPARVLIYLWSPLLAFETAHAAHVDGLILPLLVGAWWARVKARDTLVGVLLGLATTMKLDPALVSSPLLTTVTDMCGFFLLLSMASLVLPMLS